MSLKGTHIRVKIETKTRLDKLGRKNESYNDLIKRLLDFAEAHGFRKESNGKVKT